METADLANSMKPRGQLSTRVCDVAIEYIKEHSKAEKRVVVPYLVINHLLANEFTKKLVTKVFNRKKGSMLTLNNQVLLIMCIFLHPGN